MQSPISPLSPGQPQQNPFKNQEEKPEERQQNAIVSYLCGSCGFENALKPKDAIRCKECGYRIFYKKRTQKSKIFLFTF